MKNIILFTLFLNLTQTVWANTSSFEEVPKLSKAKVLGAGILEKRNEQKYRWPVSVQSIGHTMASYQSYGGAPYFHHGLDIRANSGENVYASAGGKVVNIENYAYGPLYWEVAILDGEGFLWQYHHVAKESITAEIHEAYKSGQEILAGTKIGEVVNWPVSTYGEYYHHIHLNILDKDHKYLNPFLFLDGLEDHSSPQATEFKVVKERNGYSLAITVTDLILHEKFIVPPYLTEFSVDGGEFQTYWRFDYLPGGSDNEAYVDQFYLKRDTCGNYSCRNLVFDLGFLLENGSLSRRQFPKSRGQHTITIRLTDFAGNTSEKTFHWNN